MALFDPKDLFKPVGTLVAMAGSAAIGFVAGYALGRDPTAARRLLQAVARGVDRAQLAVAETREELGDLWAEARASVQAEWEEARFAEPASERMEAGATANEAPSGKKVAATSPGRRARRSRSTAVH
jgi:hypothetical protein